MNHVHDELNQTGRIFISAIKQRMEGRNEYSCFKERERATDSINTKICVYKKRNLTIAYVFAQK